MVGPSVDKAELDRSHRRLKAGGVALVGLSAGSVAWQAGSTPAQTAVAVGGGLLLGAVLVWFVARNLSRLVPDSPAEPRSRDR